MNRNLIVVCLSFVLFSCQRNPFDVEIEEKELDFAFVRLDQEVFRSEIDDPLDRQTHLFATYPEFYKEYFEKILRIGPVDDTTAAFDFQHISNQIIFADSQNEVDSVFFFDQQLREDFLSVLQYYHHYFPQRKLPNIITMNSGFNYAVYPMKENLAIGLEFYLGENHRITNDLPHEQFPNYQKEKMDQDFLLGDAMRGYLLSTNQNKIQGDKLINHFIYQGKVMYILNALMPFEKEHFQMGYTENELLWCEKNEFNIWKAIIDEDLVWSSDYKQIQRFTGFGPFTQGFPEESPGMISLFIGKKIVLDFMNRNPEYSLEQLFNEKDEKVLNTYKPNK
ncbi:MAG: hypothetical protein AAF487_01400 [Bacteroidota bacterium]